MNHAQIPMTSPPRRFTSQDYTTTHADVFARRYDDGIHDIKVQVVRRFLGDVRGRRVLDLGCGVGNFAALCSDLGAQVVASDFATAMTAATARRYGATLPIIRSSAEAPPFSPGQFDLILALDVIEHLYQPEQMLTRARDLLRPDGRLLITTDRQARFHVGFLPIYGKNAIRRIVAALGRRKPPRPSPYETPWCTHVHEYTVQEMLTLAERAGFHLIDFDTYSLRPRYSLYGRTVEALLRGGLRQYKWEYAIYLFGIG
jgi:SAM-dependent methyltransferase